MKSQPGKWAISAIAALASIAAVIVISKGPHAVATEPETALRPAYCAGRWYPGDAKALGEQVNQLLAKATAVKLASRPIALIVPHAGYRYSGPTAAAAYKALEGQKYRRVIVIALSHSHASTYRGVDVPAKLTGYQTPLGTVPLDRTACDQLLKSSAYSSHSGIDPGEHSLELQLPFLQRAIGSFELVPLLVGQMNPTDYTEATKALLPLLDEQTLIVVSTDFTHYGPNYGYVPFTEQPTKRLAELADQAAKPILLADFDGFAEHLAKTQDTICGRNPVLLLLRALAMRAGAQGLRTAVDFSGKLTGDFTNSVTYQSFVFIRRPGTLSDSARQALLKLARETAKTFLSGQPLPQIDPKQLPDDAQRDGASFVTLKNHGRLRGCIGNMEATGPLYESVQHNAVAACQDYRFASNPVTTEELDQIDIEISYLTPMKPVSDPSEIIIGRHGLLITLHGRRGVLLPQVAYEYGWTRTEFLDQVCYKAGLPRESWKDPNVELRSFEAEVFGEKH